MVWTKRIIAIAFLIFSAVYLTASLFLPWGRTGKPGPGLVPVSVGIAMTILSLLHVIQVFFFEKGHPSEKGGGVLQRKDVLRVAGVVICLVVYMILFPTLGYTLSTVFLVGATLRLLAMHGWTRIVLISVATSVLSYYIFCTILEVQLPRGILPF
jgi:putative tricarboxylic transport membrane protein